MASMAGFSIGILSPRIFSGTSTRRALRLGEHLVTGERALLLVEPVLDLGGLELLLLRALGEQRPPGVGPSLLLLGAGDGALGRGVPLFALDGLLVEDELGLLRPGAVVEDALDLALLERDPDVVAGSAHLPALVVDAVESQAGEGLRHPVGHRRPGVGGPLGLVLLEPAQPGRAVDGALVPLVVSLARVRAPTLRGLLERGQHLGRDRVSAERVLDRQVDGDDARRLMPGRVHREPLGAAHAEHLEEGRLVAYQAPAIEPDFLGRLEHVAAGLLDLPGPVLVAGQAHLLRVPAQRAALLVDDDVGE